MAPRARLAKKAMAPRARPAKKRRAILKYSEGLIHQALDNVKLYAGSIDINGIPDPQIIVDGLGKIGFPLPKKQARRIFRWASQHASDQRSDDDDNGAVGDTTTNQDSCEIDPKNIKFAKPEEWESVIDRLLQMVSRQLNIDDPIHAHLSGMSLYGEGASFKAPTE